MARVSGIKKSVAGIYELISLDPGVFNISVGNRGLFLNEFTRFLDKFRERAYHRWMHTVH
ncbi:MAG: hypothetical protein MZV63_01330 [Marinilabiliales bacterium]|nr:hypothetical protein [Marinilabiliales bacterium]